ncbi:MAG: hypothetical protein CBE43_04555 [Rhodopirellula sp. TMED283]|nr:MAG: hypothetical protein CBE43_04555 [Rhodopirellula sp. TMED283]
MRRRFFRDWTRRHSGAMRRISLLGAFFLTLGLSGAGLTKVWAADAEAELRESSAVVDSPVMPTLRFDNVKSKHGFTLSGLDARLQLVVSMQLPGQLCSDVTHQVTYRVDHPAVVRVSDGMLIPLQDGEATITAEHANGMSVDLQVRVENTGNEAAISFPGRVVPIFTKLGCNGGGCHGKLAGQNGFKLSLLGFEPREDYEHLVRESRGRRLSPASPDQSLLLQKSVNTSPHGGGKRLDLDSHEYRILSRWISQGMPYGSDDEPQVVSIEVMPEHRRLSAESSQQLSVMATYSDGRVEDVTRAAVYESNDSEMADCNEKGLVHLKDLVGDVAVMARYQGHVTVFRADIPVSGSTITEDAFPEHPENPVDRHVFAKLHSLGIGLSPVCDDATFLRRVTLDLAGRAPNALEIVEFQKDTSPNKREQVIDRLLASEDHAEFFAGKWNTILRNRRTGGALRFANVAFHQWIKEGITENKPYDQFVREIITASGSAASHPPVVWYQQVTDTNQRIEDAAQLFLGQRIQCARCHHHPYEKWSQADYAQLSAFFTTVSKKTGRDPLEPLVFAKLGGASARHPKTGQTLKPAGLDAQEVAIGAQDDPRTHFADWMTDPSNPFFARALANRYWKHFMGRGLVEPEDDLRVTNPPSNPELLDGLANSFIESGYDLKALSRLIVTSRCYQSASDASPENIGDKRSYSRYYPKRLQAEVLLDSIDRLTLSPTKFAGMPAGIRAVALPDTGFSSYFLTVFGRPESTTACECERSQEANLSQSLHLLNSEEIQSKLAGDQGRAARLAADTKRSDEDKIRELYSIAFSRDPDDRELKATLTYVAAKENQREAFEDVLWSLINSKEFLFNH